MLFYGGVKRRMQKHFQFICVQLKTLSPSAFPSLPPSRLLTLAAFPRMRLPTYTVFWFRYMPAHFLRILFSAGSLSTCNADCACDFVKYSPICGENGNTYISGCHAGCTERIKSDGTQVCINRCFAAEMQFAKALCTPVGRPAPLSNGAKLPRPRQL